MEINRGAPAAGEALTRNRMRARFSDSEPHFSLNQAALCCGESLQIRVPYVRRLNALLWNSAIR